MPHTVVNELMSSNLAVSERLPEASTSEQQNEPSSEVLLPITQSPARTPPHSEIVSTFETPKCRKDLRKRVNLLRSVNVTSVMQLTPKARKLHRIARAFRLTAKKLDFECTDTKKRLKEAQKLIATPDLMAAGMNKTTYNFVISQIENQKLTSKARRFTLDNKITALSLWKQSPKGYKLLRKIFALPSKKTLTQLLRKVPFETGINHHVIDLLKASVETMDSLDKYCIVLFDEMAIEPLLLFDQSRDIIEGFQDNGSGERKPLFADKVMVFMACGIRKKWKQPFAYYFNEGGMKKDILSRTIKDVIRALRSTGLKVFATVCDQGSANVAAVGLLYKETEAIFLKNGSENRNFGFEVDGEEVVPIYDPPHLLKGIRNALFQYDVKYTWRMGSNKIGSWKHLVQLYELEDQDDDYKLCPKLTEAHIHNLKKMKVKMAAQIFSTRVAAAIKSIVSHGQPGRMTADALDTAEFLLFIDKAFDSVNGSRITPESGKALRSAVTDRSGHEEFWVEAIKVFQSMKFIDTKLKEHITPSVKNWVHTLKALKYIWYKLRGIGFKFICPRRFNQDPLENFFSCIRAHGVRNINPSCISFVGSLKSLIISNFVVPHSSSANCEADGLKGLDSFKEFILSSSVNRNRVLPHTFPTYTVDNEVISPLSKSKLTYIAGYISKKLLKNINDCKQCRSDLLGSSQSVDEESQEFIENRAYASNALLYPSTNFNKLFQRSVNIAGYILPKICHEHNVHFILQKNILENIKFNVFSCESHDILNLFTAFFCKFHIFVWCKNVNRILKGRDVRSNSKDPIKGKAKQKYNNHQKIIKKMRQLKN